MSYSTTAAVTFLLAMTAFYVFLSVYILTHALSRYFLKSRRQENASD